MSCEAHKDTEKKTLKSSMSTSREGPCAETQRGETSCAKDKKESKTVHDHKIDAYDSPRSILQTEDTPL